MSRRLRPLAGLALIAMVALISACGSNAPAASGSGSGGGGDNTTAAVQKGVKFAECMRSNGVAQVPGPERVGRVHHRCDRERHVAGHEQPDVHAGPRRV